MARPTVLLVVALVLVVAEPGIASKPEPISTLRRVPPLLDCGPAPVAPAAESDGFRANLLSILRVIPSAAAAAPAGFVTARSGRTGRDSAFARALCFGAASNRSSSSAAACRACLSAAARDATSGCGASRRAGVWRAGCILGYADTDATSAREDAFFGWFYADSSTTAATLKDGVCAADRTGPDCARCFEDAARAAAALPWLVRLRREVIVVGYSCCLRVQSYVLPITSELSYTISSSILAYYLTL
ncbi:unnamed protein product [Miscanthus lutarioriparius]|uniref:Gnk2-homologous domain-containing protein n=1 Tax=Miscanthus lutarioriparius TaxID=422564 RepID=A0A811SFW1_9POAL|nr:unnamed protein product [Miscanthus lutarioriparius]